MVIDNKFDIKQIVYLTTDTEQRARIVTGFSISDTGIGYELSCGSNVSTHYDYEISEEKNILITSDN